MNFNRITSGIEIESAPLASESLTIPHRIAVIGHANKSFTKPYDMPIEITDSIEASNIFGNGSQIARMVKGLDGVAGKIVCFAITATTGAKEKTVKIGASAVPNAEGKLILTFNDESITIYYAKSEALQGFFKLIQDTINSFPNLPVTAKATNATDVTITTNWTGLTANDVLITVTGDITGFTITETNATGAVPSPAKIYETFSNNWYTMAVLPFYDVETLKKVSTYAELRTDPLLHMPILNVCGCVEDFAKSKKLVEALDSRAVMVVCVPGSPTMPAEIASDEVYKRIMCSQEQPNISGRNIALRYTESPVEQWSPSQKESIVKAGGATVYSNFGNVYVDNETTTSKTVNGRENTMWRWSSTVICDMAKVHSLNQMFTQEPFDDYLIIDDASTSLSRKALKPSTVKQYLSNLMSQWVQWAWSKNLNDMLESIRVTIPTGNPQAYFVEYFDDFAVSGKRIFIRYSPLISSKV